MANSVPADVAPVAQDGSASGDEGTTITGAVVASDVDSPSLAYTVVAQVGHGTVTLNQDGSFSYTPEDDYSGSDSFTFKVNDGSLDSNVATVNLTINAVNDAPIAQDGVASGDEDTVITGTVAASDVDSASLTYTLVTQASHGSVTLNQDGSFSYTPEDDYFGSDSFTFMASEDNAAGGTGGTGGAGGPGGAGGLGCGRRRRPVRRRRRRCRRSGRCGRRRRPVRRRRRRRCRRRSGYRSTATSRPSV